MKPIVFWTDWNQKEIRKAIKDNIEDSVGCLKSPDNDCKTNAPNRFLFCGEKCRQFELVIRRVEK